MHNRRQRIHLIGEISFAFLRISPNTSPSRRTNSTTSSSSTNRSPVHHSSNISHSQSHSEWRTRNLVRNSDSISSSTTSDKPSSNDNTVIAKSPTQTTLVSSDGIIMFGRPCVSIDVLFVNEYFLWSVINDCG